MTDMMAWARALTVLALAIYDLRCRRIPNGVVLPWLLVVTAETAWREGGMVWVYLPMLALFVFLWARGVWGGGDVKMWAWLWLATPRVHLFPQAVLLLGLCWALAAPLVWVRRGRAAPRPAAWKAVPYALWLTLVVVV